MDKMTTGYATIPKGEIKQVKKQMTQHFIDLCKKEFGVDAKVTLKLIPIEEVVANPEERLSFTHAYTVRCRA